MRAKAIPEPRQPTSSGYPNTAEAQENGRKSSFTEMMVAIEGEIKERQNKTKNQEVE